MHEGKSLKYIGVWFIAFSQAKCPSMPILLAEEIRENLLHRRSLDRETKEEADAVLSSPIN